MQAYNGTIRGNIDLFDYGDELGTRIIISIQEQLIPFSCNSQMTTGGGGVGQYNIAIALLTVYTNINGSHWRVCWFSWMGS